MSDKFTFEEVFLAYKKLKNYYYNDNTSLFIKERIADFENDIAFGEDFEESLNEKFKDIVDLLNSKKRLSDFIKSEINYRVTPKSLMVRQRNVLTNRTNLEDIAVERLNYFIDAPVEIHLISMLWIMNIGVYLNDVIDCDNYAYKLELYKDYDENQKLVNGLRVFTPYYLQYQTWRDNAIKEAERVLEDKKDVVILSLDVKDYFHSVDIDFEVLKQDLIKGGCKLSADSKNQKLFALLRFINKTYTKKLNSVNADKDSFKHDILPIGLMASGILGNYYLSDFDSQVKEVLNPAYYGRYVDDIMLVLTNTKVKHNSISPVNSFLNDFFVKRGIFEFDDIKDNPFIVTKNDQKVFEDINIQDTDLENGEYYVFLHQATKIGFQLSEKKNLKIQSTKVMLQDFHYNESPALINKFKKNIEKNRSEFRYLPNEDEIDKEFDEEAFSMQYIDSINKLRSIKEFREDKYGASKYLAAKIFTSSMTDDFVDNRKTYNQILTFFKGDIGIEFHTLWEKVATFFVINNEHEALFKFYNKTRLSIASIKISGIVEDIELLKKLKSDLTRFLNISVAIPLAYNLKFNLFKLSKIENAGEIIKEVAEKFRKSNLFRNTWISIPALNFTNYLSQNDFGYNLLEKRRNNINKDFVNDNLNLCDRSIVLSPRYVHFHEVNLLEIYKTISSINKNSKQIAKTISDIPDQAFRSYCKLNNKWKFKEENEINSLTNSLRDSYFTKVDGDISSEIVKPVIKGMCSHNLGSVDKKVALANIRVDAGNIEKAFLNKPNTTKIRREELFKLMNSVEKENADFFVLPEVSVPCQWITFLAYQAKKSNMSIVGGLEHWVNDAKIAFNLMAVILPINKGPYRTCMINLRLKNHYSPDETKLLKGNRLETPRDVDVDFKKVYTLYNWKGVYFSAYNCFELADINDRSIFKSKVDFIIASEYNRDVYYFSDIGGSWVRDLHCYFIQVNSSDFGDSRILQPSSSVNRNILQIKGGENSSIVVGSLPIKKLREFQRKDYYLQKDDSTFKPTPPDFNLLYVEKRIKNENID